MNENRCPFCNRELELDIVGNNAQILCACGVSGPDYDEDTGYYESAKLAIASWNGIFRDNPYTKEIPNINNIGIFKVNTNNIQNIGAQLTFETIQKAAQQLSKNSTSYIEDEMNRLLNIFYDNQKLIGENKLFINTPENIWKGGYLEECKHKWKKYIGFTEEYEYCELCDEKRK